LWAGEISVDTLVGVWLGSGVQCGLSPQHDSAPPRARQLRQTEGLDSP